MTLKAKYEEAITILKLCLAKKWTGPLADRAQALIDADAPLGLLVIDETPNNGAESIHDQVMTEWNRHHELRTIRVMTTPRKALLSVRMRDTYWSTHWREAIEKTAASPFCTGNNRSGWIAEIDWFLRPGTLVKIMEGAYTSTETARDQFIA